ncbi:MAG: hypothetical protein AB8H79_15230 [Myxococcota bacterium]
MPQRPGHSLDLYVLPEFGVALPEAAALNHALLRAGIAEGRRPGDAAERVVVGGYAGVRIDRPGSEQLYANGQGGFRVTCSHCDTSVIREFQRALTAWRGGADRALVCPQCARSSDLAALSYRPPAGFAHGAVVLIDAQHSVLTDQGKTAFKAVLGDVRVVGARR